MLPRCCLGDNELNL
ncbi:rCG24787 [Rattus norvegicus]|uniref:RCG24787 n=1 Tax=Rattus norvegicus TaxID=10116 RepID=A6JBK4_RAT|nr:rCG24787 [Rattus norvegicus]